VSIGLIVATIILAIAMPLVMTVLAPGFVGRATLQLATDNARLMLPYLAFAGPSTVLLALASAQGRFALTAFSPLLFNGALIGVTIALLAMHRDAAFAAPALAATVGIAGLLQLLILASRGRQVATPLRVSIASEMRRFFGKALPGMVASAAPQLLAVAGAIIASHEPSAVSWLYFANRLIELPLGIVGVAMGTVLVPELTRALQAGDKAMLTHAQSRGLELAVGLALPAMLGLMILSEPIVRLLFEHGAFGAADAAATAHILGWLALALPAQVLVKALSPAFFAREDTHTPMRATLVGFVSAIAVALLLGHLFGASGIAIGLAVGAWAQALALFRHGTARLSFAIEPATRRRLPRIVLASLVMGGALWLGVAATATSAASHSGLGRAVLLLCLITGGIALYGGLLQVLGVTGWRETVRAIRARPSHGLRG
jgi:putative peptidoglycan lipid II flippase